MCAYITRVACATENVKKCHNDKLSSLSTQKRKMTFNPMNAGDMHSYYLQF